ncbi:phage tail tape measure protein [Peptococcus simiae]|uniref:phage tail tape measure protein n=1 Tax=Peptococcus simiae TaxID=1643805 RepID=UPI00397ED03B
MASDGRVVIDSVLNSDGVKAGIAEIKSQLQSVKQAGGNMSRGLANAAAAGLTVLGTAATAFGAYSIKAGIDFESAFAGVVKTVDATDAELSTLRTGIINMSKEMPQSATEIAAVAEAAGQLGISTPHILDFTKTMVMLGESTNMSSDQAAVSLARLANITGMSEENYSRLGSSIVALGNNMATTESEIVDMSLRLAGTGKQVGLTEAEILGLSAAMSSVGINAEAGGSAMSRTMQKINTAVLSGSDKVQGFAKVAGMSAEEFTAAWKERPAQAINAFVKGLDKVKKSGGDVSSTLKELGLNSLQEVDTLMRLAGASEELTKALDISQKAWEENQALQKEFGARLKTVQAQLDILKNKFTALAIAMFDSLRPAFMAGIKALQLLVAAIGHLPAPLLAALTAVMALVGSVPALVTALRALGLTAMTNAQAMVVLRGVLMGVGQALLGFLVSPIGIAVVALASLAKGVSFLHTHWQNLSAVLASVGRYFPSIGAGVQQLTGVFSGLGNVVAVLKEKFANILGPIGPAFQAALQSAGEFGAALKALFAGIMSPEAINADALVDGVVQSFNKLVPALGNLRGTLITAGSQLIATLGEAISNAGPQIAATASNLITQLTTAISTAAPALLGAATTILTGLAQGITAAAPQMTSTAMTIISGLGQGLATAAPALIGAATTLIVGLLQGLTTAAPMLITGATTVITSLIQGITTAIPTLVSAATTIIQALVNGLTTALPMLIPLAISAITTLLEALISAAPQLIEAGVQLLTALIDGLVQALPQIIDAAIQLVQALLQAIISNAPQLLAAGVQLITALISGVLSLTGALVGAAGSLIAAALGTILGFLGQMLSAGVQLIGQLISGIASRASQVAAKVRSAVQGAVTAAKSFVGRFLGIGRDMIQGLINGIMSMASAVAEAAASVVKGAITAAMSMLKSHSPSRVFMDLGRWTGEGFIIGIDGQKKKVAKAGGNMAGAMIDATAKVLGIASPSKVGLGMGANVGQAMATGMASVEQKVAEDIARSTVKITDKVLAQQAKNNRRIANEVARIGNQVKKITEDIGKKTISAQEKYHKAMTKSREDLAKEEQRITDAYEREFQTRADKLAGWVKTFDEVPKRAEVTGTELLKNLKAQNAAFEDWQNDMATLTERGIEEGLLKELQEAGPKAAGEIKALVSMTKEAWATYQKEWVKKQDLAKVQSFIDTTDARKKMATDLAAARQKAQEEMDGHTMEYIKALDTVQREAVKKLADLSAKGVDLGADFVNEVINGIRTRVPEFEKTTEGLAAAMKRLDINDFKPPTAAALTASIEEAKTKEPEFKTIGQRMMQGLVKGVQDGKSSLVNAMTRAVQGAISAAKDELGIASPSKVMQREVGRWIPAGMAEGMLQGSSGVRAAAERMAAQAMTGLGHLPGPAIRPAFSGAYGGSVDKSRHYNSQVTVENINTSETAKSIAKLDEEMAWLQRQRERGLGRR